MALVKKSTFIYISVAKDTTYVTNGSQRLSVNNIYFGGSKNCGCRSDYAKLDLAG